MSGSCCGDSSKSGYAKVAMTATQHTTETAAEQPAANKSECCEDKPAKSEKRACGC
jgi:hypothetical protein